MIICPTCFNEELEGALFCGSCGTQLTYQMRSPTETLLYTKPGQPKPEAAGTQVIQTETAGPARVAFRILSTGQILPVEGGEEFTIGRISGTQPILPDIDLTPYQAYEGGVSRLHATLHVSPEGVSISDLGSSNGTRVNGMRIHAHVPHPLANGDTVTLGKFQVEVMIRS
jgi:pSer/pThr/pTyr-binding forkhead associated (FHA) protein